MAILWEPGGGIITKSPGFLHDSLLELAIETMKRQGFHFIPENVELNNEVTIIYNESFTENPKENLLRKLKMWFM